MLLAEDAANAPLAIAIRLYPHVIPLSSQHTHCRNVRLGFRLRLAAQDRQKSLCRDSTQFLQAVPLHSCNLSLTSINPVNPVIVYAFREGDLAHAARYIQELKRETSQSRLERLAVRRTAGRFVSKPLEP